MKAYLFQGIGETTIIETMLEGPLEEVIEALEARGFEHLGGPLPAFKQLVGPWLHDDTGAIAFCDFECFLALA